MLPIVLKQLVNHLKILNYSKNFKLFRKILIFSYFHKYIYFSLSAFHYLLNYNYKMGTCDRKIQFTLISNLFFLIVINQNNSTYKLSFCFLKDLHLNVVYRYILDNLHTDIYRFVFTWLNKFNIQMCTYNKLK